MAQAPSSLAERLELEFEAERRALGTAGIDRLLAEGRAWDLAPTLDAGGTLVFPHANLLSCGHQIAAVVEACLDSGADRVVVIGVLHAQTPDLQEARARVAAGGDVSCEALWGIQGPGVAGPESWRREFSLANFLFLWKEATRRRGTPGPELILRYPYLVGDRPDLLPGVEALQALAADAVVVTTADPFHHGVGYGTKRRKARFPERGGLKLARKRIEEGLALMGTGDHAGYVRHCLDAKSDARDAGPLTRHLVGPVEGRILDLAYQDTTALYDQPAPTWVATALIEMRRVSPRQAPSRTCD